MTRLFEFIKNVFRKKKQQDINDFIPVEISYRPEFLFEMNLPYSKYVEFEEI